jgi:DNA-binding NarL/FixJ family response regulator
VPFNLLIVDDSQPIRASLRGLLSRDLGTACIREAATLEQAVQCARQVVPNLVILDLHLPDGLGLHIIGSLKQLSPDLHIAMLTIHADECYRQQCLALGAHWFFDKSTEFKTLIDVVRQQVALFSSISHHLGEPP